MFQRESKRNRSAPGMSENYCGVDPDLLKSTMDKIRLCFGSPDRPTRTRAVTKAGSVENNHAMLLRQQLHESAGLKILDHAAVAMEQDNRTPRAVIEIV